MRLLGTAAGGGFPQWNCRCTNCRDSRENPKEAEPRLQSGIAVSADGDRWFLVNASPDIRFQVEAFPPLRGNGNTGRGSAIEAVLLTNGDLDHTLGLVLLREGEKIRACSSISVRSDLERGLGLISLLDSYCGIEWLEPPQTLAPLPLRGGGPSGLLYRAFSVPGKPPRYSEAVRLPAPDDCIGYRVEDAATGGTLVCIPDIAALDERTTAEIAQCDLLLIDGTFWSDNEMEEVCPGGRSAASMGHATIGGELGTLKALKHLRETQVVYVHINNTNPILRAHSPERAELQACGIECGFDGMQFVL
ncbi:MAG TPA: pyrroloquinoline quinone biosynthesis protein PqqB [Chthonomonadales bacterium]|nr:pyrroloquinoline quinone biosynthesis protein PqqB [Chthonomonadales bacterium]